MHFIKKGESPKFFEDNKKWYVENDPKWGNLDVTTDLRKHLITEQSQRCIYCECGMSNIKSHVEHILPKSTYPDLTFEYENLAASCDGGQGPSRSCGQKKGDDFDPDLFLDPTKQPDIEEFFSYDVDTGTVQGSEKNEERASYMIILLNLNNPKLNAERKNAFEGLLKNIKKHPNRRKALELFFRKKNQPFISFLRFRFRKIL